MAQNHHRLRRIVTVALGAVLLPGLAAVGSQTVFSPAPDSAALQPVDIDAPGWQAAPLTSSRVVAPPAPAPAGNLDRPAPTRTRRRSSASVSAPRPVAPRSCPAAPAPPTSNAVGAHAIVSRVDLYKQPGGSPYKHLTNPTQRDNQPLFFQVVAGQGADWYKVKVSERPNGTMAWIKAKTVETYTISYFIQVELCARRLTLYDRGTPVMRESVAVGKPSTPTPRGVGFIDYIVPGGGGSYGTWMLSLSMFSDVLQGFGGGIGQIAIHGTNRPSAIGTAASAGCVRMHNKAVEALERAVYPGTPVRISA